MKSKLMDFLMNCSGGLKIVTIGASLVFIAISTFIAYAHLYKEGIKKEFY